MSGESATAIHKGQVDLLGFIDWIGVECLNQSTTLSVSSAIKQETLDNLTCSAGVLLRQPSVPLLCRNETFEKLGAIGTLLNLLVYLTTVFNLNNVTATNIINIFNGSTNVATLLGAFVSDTYFGRYNTLGFCIITSFLGLLAIQLTAVFKNLHPPSCAKESSTCIGPTAGQMMFLFSGFCLLLIGAAGIRPCNLAFGVDQFNPKTESGKKGINSFFNWYYFTFTFAQMISLSLIVYVQSSVSWAIGLGIPAALMLLACVLFFMGDKLYVKVKPSGSPIKSIVQVLVVAVKKRRVKLPAQHPMLSLFDYVPSKCDYPKLPHTYQFRRLLSYPSGAKHVKCSCCQTVNIVFEGLSSDV